MPIRSRILDPKTGRDISRGASFSEGTNATRVLPAKPSLFGETVSVSRTPVVELNSSYGTSALRDIETTSGTGTITSSSTGEVALSTGTTAGSEVTLESAEAGRYTPGFGGEIGIGLRLGSLPQNDSSVTWGGWSEDQQNGLYFKASSDGISVVKLVDGVETELTQDQWNEDKLDGNGPSGAILDLSKGNIYQIDLSWYGYGQIKFSVVIPTPDGQRPVTVHSFSRFETTSISSPNLRVFASATNGTTTNDVQVHVGGRQYSVVGKYVPKFRFTGDTRTTVSATTTVKPLISFRAKSGFKDRSIKVSGYNLLNNGSNDVFVQIRLDGSLTGASWGTPTNYTAAETAVERDRSATAITGGEVIWAGDIIGAGNGNKFGASDINLDFDIPSDSTITLCVASFSATSNVKSGFTLTEEW